MAHYQKASLGLLFSKVECCRPKGTHQCASPRPKTYCHCFRVAHRDHKLLLLHLGQFFRTPSLTYPTLVLSRKPRSITSSTGSLHPIASSSVGDSREEVLWLRFSPASHHRRLSGSNRSHLPLRGGGGRSSHVRLMADKTDWPRPWGPSAIVPL